MDFIVGDGFGWFWWRSLGWKGEFTSHFSYVHHAVLCSKTHFISSLLCLLHKCKVQTQKKKNLGDLLGCKESKSTVHNQPNSNRIHLHIHPLLLPWIFIFTCIIESRPTISYTTTALPSSNIPPPPRPNSLPLSDSSRPKSAITSLLNHPSGLALLHKRSRLPILIDSLPTPDFRDLTSPTIRISQIFVRN